MTITVKQLREAIKDLSDDARVYYLTNREADRDESHETADCPGIEQVETDLYQTWVGDAHSGSYRTECVLIGENPHAKKSATP